MPLRESSRLSPCLALLLLLLCQGCEKAFCAGETRCRPVTLVATHKAHVQPIHVRIQSFTVPYTKEPTRDDGPERIAAGRDGALWFTENFGDEVGRLSPGGTFTLFRVPNVQSALDIAYGRDKNVWITERGGVIRLTSSGTPHFYPAPPLNVETPPCPRGQQAQPIDLTSGADGAIYTTEQYGNAIDRFDVTGKAIAFPIPLTGYDRVSQCWQAPQSIALGPDNALWFTEHGGNAIGRVTTRGEITQFLLPWPDIEGISEGYEPAGIVSGGDRALWFAEETGHIGRLTLDGGLSQFDLPDGMAPQYVALASDGALWFTDSLNGTIGRLTASGSLGLINARGPTLDDPHPDASLSPSGIVRGSDGAMWVAEISGNRILRISF